MSPLYLTGELIIIIPVGGCLFRITDSRNRQEVTSIVRTEAGTACSEDIVALACRGRNGKEVRDTYLCALRSP